MVSFLSRRLEWNGRKDVDVDGAKVARSWGVVRWWDFISCVGFSVEG